MKTVVFITDSDFSNTDKTFEYLLGFQPSFGGILLLENEINIFLDSRYFENRENINEVLLKDKIGIEDLQINYHLIESGENKLLDAIISKISEKNKIYLENNIASKYYDYFLNNIKSIKIRLIENYFGEKRIIKQKDEIKNIEKAIEIIDNTFIYIKNLADKGELAGKTELEVRGIVISKIMELGGSGESFDTIVAFAENSAIPHHFAGNTIITTGVLLIDMGALYNSYCSDFTRTFWVGEKNDDYKEFLKIKNIVKKAHNKAFEKGKSGIKGKDLDIIARKVIQNEGYGEYFSHSLGHGVGLDIHEKPGISKLSEDKLINNMFFTIEPGIYLPGKFGVRLEDIVLMRNDKLEKFSKVEL